MVKSPAGQRGTIVYPGGQMGFIGGAHRNQNLKILIMIRRTQIVRSGWKRKQYF
jgi:hypothetical protein